MEKNKTKFLIILTVLVVFAIACTAPSEVIPTATTAPTLINYPTATAEVATIQPSPTPAEVEPGAPTEENGANTGTVVFSDDFSDEDSGWDIWSEDSLGFTVYNDGKYQIGVNSSMKYLWANPYQNFTDVIVAVDVEKISSDDDVQMGIICRHQDVNNWYALIYSGDGYAAIRKRSQTNGLETITEWVDAPSVNRGAASNQLRAECIGDRLALYVNDELAVETSDNDIQTGDIGLIAGTLENASSIDVFFDNLVVSSP